MACSKSEYVCVLASRCVYVSVLRFVYWRFAWFVQIRRIVVAAAGCYFIRIRISWCAPLAFAFCLYLYLSLFACLCACVCVSWGRRRSYVCLACCCCCPVLFGRFWFGFLEWMIRIMVALLVSGQSSSAAADVAANTAFPSIVRISFGPSSTPLLSHPVVAPLFVLATVGTVDWFTINILKLSLIFYAQIIMNST